jgi:hypothetical protein
MLMLNIYIKKYGEYVRNLVNLIAALLVTIVMVLVPGSIALASLAPTFNQTINSGTLTASINQAGDTTPVSAPTVSFPAQNYSFSCNTSTSTLGNSNNLINVTNLASGINTWNIALAATGGTTATWTGTASSAHTYAYNNIAGSPAGCTSGDLTVNPATGTITLDCNSACTSNNSTVSLGSSAAYNGSTTTSVTLMSDSAGTAWEGYVTGISLSQTIPPLTPSDSYTLPMTITLAHT